MSVSEPRTVDGVARAKPTTGRRIIDTVGATNLGLIIALLALGTFLTFRTPNFLTAANLLNIALAVSLLGILAISQTVVIVSGGLDISVGSIAGLASVSTAMIVGAMGTAVAGIVGGIIVGILAGIGNGLIITVGRVNPVIATLATLSAYRGLAFILTDGKAVGVTDQAFNSLGSGRLGFIPYPVIIFILAAVGFGLLMRYTDIGRNIYAMGANPAAARLAGIGLDRYKLGIYALSGAAAGLAGVLLTARTTSGQPASGSQGLELEAITAAVLGGAALSGGRGTVVGALLGVFVIGTLNNGLILLNVPTFYQLVAKGLLLVFAVVLSERRFSFRRGAG
jgi:ribose transport system permease protein/L-arabinose transport system permease protein